MIFTDARLWLTKHNMQFNELETSIINITRSSNIAYAAPVSIGVASINLNSPCKLLGITVDNKLSFQTHIQNICKKPAGKLLLMRQLKLVGMDREGLQVFCVGNIRSLMNYVGCTVVYANQ